METSREKRRFNVSLEDLQTFIAVANLGGVGRAARYLSLSQPSVSNRIRRLEEKLKVKLVERNESGIALTDNGRRLHQEAVETLIGLTDLLQEFHSDGLDGKRSMVLSVTIMMAQIKLPCILRDFRAAYPDITVHVHDQSVSECTESLVNGQSDLALMTCEDLPTTLDHELMVIDESVLVASLKHPLNRAGGVTLQEILSYPILLPKAHYPQLNPLYDAVASRGLKMQLAPEAEGVRHPLTLMTMAAAGLGVLIFPKTLVPQELDHALATIDICDVPIQRRIGLTWVKGRRLSAAARCFRQFIVDARAPDYLTWPDGRRVRAPA